MYHALRIATGEKFFMSIFIFFHPKFALLMLSFLDTFYSFSIDKLEYVRTDELPNFVKHYRRITFVTIYFSIRNKVIKGDEFNLITAR